MTRRDLHGDAGEEGRLVYSVTQAPEYYKFPSLAAELIKTEHHVRSLSVRPPHRGRR